MLKDLTKVASKLDKLGLTAEADFIDSLILKLASEEGMISAAEESILSLKKKIKDYYGDRLPSIDLLQASPETMAYHVQELPGDKEELYKIISSHIHQNDFIKNEILPRENFLKEIRSLWRYFDTATSTHRAILIWLRSYERVLNELNS